MYIEDERDVEYVTRRVLIVTFFRFAECLVIIES